MKTNTLDSYNFLATLTEQGKDLFQTVYIPICKRALCHYSRKRKEFGTDVDLQQELFELYGLNVPLTVVRQLLKGVEKTMTRKEKQITALQIFENGKNFRIELFEFDKYEKTYELIQKENELLQEAFEKYSSNHPEFSEDYELLKFSEFIDRNKTKLSTFYSGKNGVDSDTGKSFLLHAQFLEYVQFHNQKLFEISEKIYFGSIVASYLESNIELNAKFNNDEEYFIDTQIILRALDVQDEFDTQPARELLELIKASGGTPKVLGITLSEIDYAFQVAIDNYNKLNPTTTINQACIRRSKNKAWLISEQQNLEGRITELGFIIDKIPKNRIDEYKKSQDIKSLQGTRKKRANAEHDVLAYLHVRSLRENMVRTYQKAKFWFVSSNNNLYHFNKSTLPQGIVGEVITPDTLTSLLWLKGNSSLDASIKKIGLNELVIQTIHEEIATRELINELHETVKASNGIKEEDYNTLLTSVAHQSAKKLNRLIDLSYEDKERYNAEIHLIINKERERKNRQLKESQKATQNIEELRTTKDSLNSELSLIEERLKETSVKSQAEIDSLRSELNNQKTSFKKFKKSIYLLLASILVLLIALIAIETWNNLKIILTSISGLGGLWGFISLLINLYKLSEK